MSMKVKRLQNQNEALRKQVKKLDMSLYKANREITDLKERLLLATGKQPPKFITIKCRDCGMVGQMTDDEDLPKKCPQCGNDNIGVKNGNDK